MYLNYYLCNYLMGKFGNLFINNISQFNYDLVIVFDFHVKNQMKSFCHIKVH